MLIPVRVTLSYNVPGRAAIAIVWARVG
jgi:hypothetical protein